MPDENGDLYPGELGGGAYGALEGDLGEKLRPLAGFGRPLEPAVSQQEGFWEDEEEELTVSPGGFSTGLPARYSLKDWE